MKPVQFAIIALLPCLAFSKSPNLIIILVDDMGYSDFGCYGGEIATPAINKLAAEGVRITRFQNAGMCVVTRASMLTGQWWPRGLRNFKDTPLLSEKLQNAGYRTALIRKKRLSRSRGQRPEIRRHQHHPRSSPRSEAEN